METKLYVGNLPYSATEEQLKEIFSNAGTVKSVSLIKDRFSGESKGFGFVEMETQVDMEKAISMFDGYTLENRQIKVNIAKPREDRGGGFGQRSSGGKRDRGRSGGSGGNKRDRNGGGGRRNW